MTRPMFIAGLALFLGAVQAPAYSAGTATPAATGSIPHVSGGIGEGEQQQLLARQRDYNLKLVFTLNEGNYIADVNVAVKDKAGKTVLEDVSGGPFFLAKLPAGQYSVVATYDGKAVTRKVSVGSGLHTEQFRWAANPQVDFVSRSGKD
ncbi:MAG TPA: carboxypeptidase-like regulatory domain-containing protein [Burkholderiales bacterium]|nr:carboxypeptidase-like regulatory domain-containing protein [Burkholderiales bacterium]